MRIAEMYLIAAEAEMKAGNLTEAAKYVNILRTARAKTGKVAEMQVLPNQLTLDFMLEERGRELGGEQLRWFDLKRTGKLIEYVKAYNPNAKANIKDFQLVRPIPQSHLDVITNKSEFQQNPGW